MSWVEEKIIQRQEVELAENLRISGFLRKVLSGEIYLSVNGKTLYWDNDNAYWVLSNEKTNYYCHSLEEGLTLLLEDK